MLAVIIKTNGITRNKNENLKIKVITQKGKQNEEVTK